MKIRERHHRWDKRIDPLLPFFLNHLQRLLSFSFSLFRATQSRDKIRLIASLPTRIVPSQGKKKRTAPLMSADRQARNSFAVFPGENHWSCGLLSLVTRLNFLL